MKQFFTILQGDKSLYFFAIAVSILLSYWINSHQILINPDAICYLLSAKAVESGIHGAMQLCGQANWPFYSIFIYGFAYLTHLDYTIAAYVLDGILSFLSVITFILIVKELGGSRSVLWI